MASTSALVPAAVRSYLEEPAPDGAPRRVWRDYALIGVTSITAIVEVVFRTDPEWTVVPEPWQWASLVMFFVTVPPALWFRRSHPLPAALWGFGLTVGFGILGALAIGEFGGLFSTAVTLVCLYTLVRWGSGRHGAWGVALAVGGGVLGTAADPSATVGDWIGGMIVLSIPIQLGLAVRYQRNARHRAIEQAKSAEREELARDLHDTVAHHVSAIAVQAQAGQAVAARDPNKAVEVLAVIEEAASRTLTEMRSIVGSLRDLAAEPGGLRAGADMAPQPDLDDLRRLAEGAPGDLRVEVSIDDDLDAVGSAAQTALYRIAQESITNVLRHAPQATLVRIEVDRVGDTVRMRVTDDGTSATNPLEPGGSNGTGFGLLGMAERVALLGGTFEAGPTAERSWQVEACVPGRTAAASP